MWIWEESDPLVPGLTSQSSFRLVSLRVQWLEVSFDGTSASRKISVPEESQVLDSRIEAQVFGLDILTWGPDKEKRSTYNVEVGETAHFFRKVLEFCSKVAILQELCIRMNNQEVIFHLKQNSSIAALRKD